MVHVCTLNYIAHSSSFFKRYGSTSKSNILLVFGGRTLILTVQKAVADWNEIWSGYSLHIDACFQAKKIIFDEV